MPHRADSTIHPRRIFFFCSSPPFSFLRLREFCVDSFFLLLFSGALTTLWLQGCSRNTHTAPNVLTFLIESSPTNLDPRFATDTQSQRIDGLLFSGLLERDNQMNFHGDLAEFWDTPNPLTYVFHLRRGVYFHDGRPLTSADVKATIDFIMNPANRSPKRGAFRMVDSIEAPDEVTVSFHLSEPYASFTVNLIPSAVGIVPANAGPDFSEHPIGSGPFRFVRQTPDEEVVLERNPKYLRGVPQLDRVRFRIVPDAVVRALELRKGSADLEMSSLSPDLIPVLSRQPDLDVTDRTGTNFTYLGLNLEDSALSHREVRQGLAFATDGEALIRYLLHGQAKLATGVLPPDHWAAETNVTRYAYDPGRAEQLLDAAGFKRKQAGVRFHLTLKCSTEEQARLIGAALQEQWRRVGIDLEIRPLELATLFSDVVKGNFQLTYQRWVGANSDPDFFEFAFSSKRFPPDGANRGHYRSQRMDALTDQIRVEMNQEKRKALCGEVQRILAEDLPYIPLWFNDVVSVHRRSLGPLELSPTADYDFLVDLHPATTGK
ncbi:MAG TPA: ABC transporter substrate-binding protein [Candidatus Acidoferrum sp.]|jgi:peptide/nickel transport system substrate-binding protein|nr:ABC transporter substrate-binding protein [Candidatus Acidoferrum sp.]